MTAVSEINVDRLEDVLAVPVQAIVQIENETWCYAETDLGVEKRVVELGRNNDKFVQLLSGVDAGTRVVLNPMAIYKQDLNRSKDISPDAGAPEFPETSSGEEDVAMSPTAQTDSATATTKSAAQGKSRNQAGFSGEPDP